jgi:hypothetical protein
VDLAEAIQVQTFVLEDLTSIKKNGMNKKRNKRDNNSNAKSNEP